MILDTSYLIKLVSRMYSVTRLNEEMARRAGQLHPQANKEKDGNSGADAIDAMVAAVAETAAIIASIASAPELPPCSLSACAWS